MFIGAYSLPIIILFIGMNKCLFDLAKAKSELIAEFHTEYSSFFWFILFKRVFSYVFL